MRFKKYKTTNESKTKVSKVKKLDLGKLKSDQLLQEMNEA